jgi:hypothetical protein
MRKRDLQSLHEIVEAAGGFGHREHLQLAWTYLHRYSIDEASAVHVQRWDGASFAEFLERNPDLLKRDLIHHFYSPDLLRSEPARASWRPPDLHQLPVLV